MKMAVRTNNMARMKQVFTNEIFTESTVAAHAVKERKRTVHFGSTGN